jgi:hypothetical protein
VASQSERRGELRPHRPDFDRLVQERIADAKSCGARQNQSGFACLK